MLTNKLFCALLLSGASFIHTESFTPQTVKFSCTVQATDEKSIEFLTKASQQLMSNTARDGSSSAIFTSFLTFMQQIQQAIISGFNFITSTDASNVTLLQGLEEVAQEIAQEELASGDLATQILEVTEGQETMTQAAEMVAQNIMAQASSDATANTTDSSKARDLESQLQAIDTVEFILSLTITDESDLEAFLEIQAILDQFAQDLIIQSLDATCDSSCDATCDASCDATCDASCDASCDATCDSSCDASCESDSDSDMVKKFKTIFELIQKSNMTGHLSGHIHSK